MKYKTIQKTIAIKRRIAADDNIRHFIRHNSNKRRFIWNKFVEKYYECVRNKTLFKTGDLRKLLVHEDIATLKQSSPNTNIYRMFCSDVVLGVYKDINKALQVMRTMDRKNDTHSKLHFKSYDPCKKTFRVRTGNEISPSSKKARGKVHFKSLNVFEFRASHDCVRNTFDVQLMENIADRYDSDTNSFISLSKHPNKSSYSFKHEDITDIVFLEEFGKCYAMLMIHVTYYIPTSDADCRYQTAGIDLGLHTPVTLYSENDDRPIILSFDMGSKTISRMKYYERKCEKIQKVMDIKYKINKAIHASNPSYPIYSKRYRKLQKRFRRYWRKIVNIRRNWRYTKSNKLVSTFANIVVDEFEPPSRSVLKSSKKVHRLYYHYTRDHSMWDFTQALQHCAVKSGCNYIHSPEFTTVTCSKCGHVNEKLPLDKRYLTCSKCKLVIDRDVNAAMNCYDFYSKRNR